MTNDFKARKNGYRQPQRSPEEYKQFKKEEKEAVYQLVDSAVANVVSSPAEFQKFLDTQARMDRYSAANALLIYKQCPEATQLKDFDGWREENVRIKKGAKSISILEPVDYTRADGTQGISYNVKKVFDVSQTSGDPLPTLASELNETVDSFEEMKSVLISISPVPVSFETINGGANGYYSPTSGKIVIDEHLPQLQMLKTMVHEIAHATLGHGSKEDKWDRQTKEVQAESVAYWVTQMIGLDTSDYSFGYISGWSKDKEVSELKESLDVIKQTADKLSSSIEEKVRELKKERESLPMVSEEKEPYIPTPHKKR